MTDYAALVEKLEDMADRRTRYHYSVNDYWTALGDAAHALRTLSRETQRKEQEDRALAVIRDEM